LDVGRTLQKRPKTASISQDTDLKTRTKTKKIEERPALLSKLSTTKIGLTAKII